MRPMFLLCCLIPACRGTPEPAPEPTVDAVVVEGRWSATAEFPGTANPNGVWTYGYAGSPGASDVTVFVALDEGLYGPAWIDPNNVEQATPTVWLNNSVYAIDGVPSGSLGLHLGLHGEYTLLRFKAPARASYEATIQLTDSDRGSTHATIFSDGAIVAASAVGGTAPTFTRVFSSALDAGDTIELWIGPDGDGSNDNTPVTFSVVATR